MFFYHSIPCLIFPFVSFIGNKQRLLFHTLHPVNHCSFIGMLRLDMRNSVMIAFFFLLYCKLQLFGFDLVCKISFIPNCLQMFWINSTVFNCMINLSEHTNKISDAKYGIITIYVKQTWPNSNLWILLFP